MAKKTKEKKFYGTTTMGKKGQIVIPIEARKEINLKEGEKLFVFGMGDDIIAIIKFSKIERLASALSKKLSEINKLINKKYEKK